ncbi:hypothetical protein ACFE04_028356 [Oxalis oulophora]
MSKMVKLSARVYVAHRGESLEKVGKFFETEARVYGSCSSVEGEDDLEANDPFLSPIWDHLHDSKAQILIDEGFVLDFELVMMHVKKVAILKGIVGDILVGGEAEIPEVYQPRGGREGDFLRKLDEQMALSEMEMCLQVYLDSFRDRDAPSFLEEHTVTELVHMVSS